MAWVVAWSLPGAALFVGLLVAGPSALFAARVDPLWPHIGVGLFWPLLVLALLGIASMTGSYAPYRLLVALVRAWRRALPFLWVAPALIALALLPSATGVIGVPLVIVAMGAAAGARGGLGAMWAEGWEIAWRTAVFATIVSMFASAVGVALGLVMGWPGAAVLELAEIGVFEEGWLVRLAGLASGLGLVGGLVTVLSGVIVGFSLAPGHAVTLLERLRAQGAPS